MVCSKAPLNGAEMEQKSSHSAAATIESSCPSTRESAVPNPKFRPDMPTTPLRRSSGRPRRDDLDPMEIARLRDEKRLSWRQLARQLRAGSTTVRRLYVTASSPPAASTPCQNSPGGIV